MYRRLSKYTFIRSKDHRLRLAPFCQDGVREDFSLEHQRGFSESR